jgi:hypothetical protein
VGDEVAGIRQAWQALLQECALAENYHLAYQVSGSPLTRNPVLEQLLPSFAYVRMVSLAAEALRAYIGDHEIVCTHRSEKGKLLHARDDLFSLAECLKASHHLTEALVSGLHDVRERRKALAHESHPVYVTWDDLRRAVVAVEAPLASLGLIEDGVRYEVKATQHAAEMVAGRFVQKFTLTASAQGKRVREIGWCINF